jgi:hypothetical protein
MDTPPPPPPIIYLSQQHIVADGKTDESKPLQVLFDRAGDGEPIEIVNDLPGPVMTSGNDVWPRTTVRTLEGGKWILSPGSVRGILRNKHPTASWPKGVLRQDGKKSDGPTPPEDADIAIVGGVFDGNRRSGGWPNDGRTPNNEHPVLGRDNLLVSTLQFYGVKHLTLRDVHVYDSPSLAIHVGNIFDMVSEDCSIECPSVIYNSNTDGFHINGPATNLSIYNLKLRQTGDDALPFNADDSMESTTEGNQATYFGMSCGWGPIEHVRVHGVYFDRCSSGIRMLSATQRIDDVIISDIQGTCMAGPILLDKYLFNHDPGNIGTATFENVHVATLGPSYDGMAPGPAVYPASPVVPSGPPGEVVLCHEKFENLIFRNITHVGQNASRWASIWECDIGMLSVDRFTFHDTAPGTDGTQLIHVDPSATVHSMSVTGVNWLSMHKQSGAFIGNAGKIDRLSVVGSLLPHDAKELVGNAPGEKVAP